MPRVLGIVSFRIFPTYMGGQKGVALFYRYLKREVEVVLALSRDNQPTEELETLPLLHPNRQIYKNLSVIGQLKQLILDRKIDLLIAEHSYAGWIAHLAGKPFILHSHNIEGQRFRKMGKRWWPLYHRYEGWIHRKALHNFFISQEDLEYAVRRFRLDRERCTVITYGVEERRQYPDREALRQELGLPPDRKLLLFNGTLDYEPNYEAVLLIIDTLIPLFRERAWPFEVIITGNRAPRELAEKMLACPNQTYAGYVPDVDQYYQAADLFINPVANDTGVKTKLIEALANHCPAVSTRAGATGIPQEICGAQLQLVEEENWPTFVAACERVLGGPRTATPTDFFDHYLWTHIAQKAAAIIQRSIPS